MKKIIRIAAIILCLIILLFMGVYLGARYGWRLFGFGPCITPTGILASEIIVDDGTVSLKGYTSHSAPAYVGYIYEEKDGNLYIGLKYNLLFGFSKRIGAFDIQIKCNTEDLSRIYFKNGSEEEMIWEKE